MISLYLPLTALHAAKNNLHLFILKLLTVASNIIKQIIQACSRPRSELIHILPLTLTNQRC